MKKYGLEESRIVERFVDTMGGMVFLEQMLQKIGFRKLIDRNEDLP